MRQTIKLTESELRNIIQESVRKILNETEDYGQKQTVEKIPTWALAYLINGDPSGLEDEDIAMVDKWQDRSGVYNVCVPNDDDAPYLQVILPLVRHAMYMIAFAFISD